MTSSPGAVPAVRPGSPVPLGATPRDGGTNFAVFSEVAAGMAVCLFADDGTETRLALTECDAGVWHGFVPGVPPGTRYGFRASGEHAPTRGLRTNPAKLLLDPYARAIHGDVRFGPELADDDPRDSAPSVPRSVVVDAGDPGFGPLTPRPWRRAYADTVIYEVHVKGITQTHPAVPPALRGTYAGLAHDAVIDHLVALGVTAVELLPVQHSVPERKLVERGLTNYWGYNPIGYFAPHAAYSAACRDGRPGDQVAEFRAMVERLHAAGLEVILDVVFNHTAEGDHTGPTLCHRGLDNAAYYRLDPQDLGRYVDTTGTGNSLNVGHPRCLQMIMDSLRFWAGPMGVDGFRFDLASSLARANGDFDPRAAFFDLVAQDPLVAQAKLIAEPWDVGREDSYAVGRFPLGWVEWNGCYRDSVRDFWRSHEGMAGELATRITGSSDLYGEAGRGPTASVNFVTAHDGFTLRDLVSYDAKHNHANGDDNRDGADDNRSWNCGVEGPTDDPAVHALRARQSRAFLATLLCSFGVPMLLGGDELGRTQLGNNNAYCQDDEISWFDWDHVDHDLLAFTRGLIAFRRAHPVFRRRRFLAGMEASELAWFGTNGQPMTGADWVDPATRCVTLFLDGHDAPDRAHDGRPLVDDDFLLVVNAWWEPLAVALPGAGRHRAWRPVFDTTTGEFASVDAPAVAAGDPVTAGPRSLTVLRGVGAGGQVP
ncbi:MAG: glycogen debranching protein GlgX [Acidimicrobiia bacterium]